MEKKSFGEPSERVLFPCSGASNYGQISNEVVLRLRDAGKGKMSCIAGIGGHVKGLVDGAKQTKYIIAIDGCDVACVKKCLEAEGLQPAAYFVISKELGIEKTGQRPKEEDIQEAFMMISEKI